MEISQLISILKSKSVKVRLEGENLKISASKKALDNEVVALLKAHKPALIEYLKKREANTIVREKIGRVAPADYYEISHAQKRLWLIHQMDHNPLAYNISVVRDLDGGIDIARLRRAVHQLVARHEILRTSFHLREGKPVQKVHADLSGEVVSSMSLTNLEEAQRIADEELYTLFDLEQLPLFKLKVLQLEEQVFVVFTVHHIIIDGWSMDIFFNDLIHFYQDPNDISKKLPPLPIQYKDYAKWQSDRLAGAHSPQHSAFWLDQMSGELPQLELPSVKPRPDVKTNEGKTLSFRFDKELSTSIGSFCNEQHFSLFVVLLSSFKALLYHYTRQKDLIVGVPVAGRDHPDLEKQIGFYVNTLPIRTKLDQSASFKDLLETVKGTFVKALDNQFYPFDKLVDDLKLPSDAGRSPLFDVMVVLQNASFGPKETSVDTEAEIAQNYTTSKFDLTLNFEEDASGIVCHLEFSTDLFDDEWIHRLWEHLHQLVQEALKDINQPLAEISYISEQERKALLPATGFSTQYPSPQLSIPAIFEEVVLKTPEAIAVRYGENKMTYRALNVEVNQLAHYLIAHYQPGQESIIGLEIHDPLLRIVAILAILKSGAAYLPVDPQYPALRRDYLINESKAELLLTDTDHQENSRSVTVDCVNLKALADSEYASSNPDIPIEENALAYVIYTSGSTGKPKGVMIEHQNCVNFIIQAAERFGITPEDNILQFSSISFDASIVEIFGALLTGAGLTLIDRSQLLEPTEFVAALKAGEVTVATLPPSYLSVFDPSALGFLRCVITVGEHAIKKQADQYSQLMSFFNGYGPTECTVISITYQEEGLFKQLSSVPIGLPLKNTATYILTEDLQLVPDGMVGELCISGKGVGRGYLGNEELTAAKFIPNPHAQGERLYITGDYGRRLPDGNIEILGRKDDQVKIRGFRIELGEIAATIQSIEGVVEAIVLPVDSEEIVAFVVMETMVDIKSIKANLAKRLPEYMVPGTFFQVDQFPLNPNGKVDKASLLSRHKIGEKVMHAAAEGLTELRLHEVFSGLTGLENISVEEDLFDLGVNSLVAIRSVMKISKEFQVAIQVADLFQLRTIRNIAQLIEEQGQTPFEPIVPVAQADHYPLSHSQKRLWVLDQVNDGESAYTIPLVFQLNGRIDGNVMIEALETIVARHESLRTNFIKVEGQPRQVITSNEENHTRFSEIDCTNHSSEEVEALIDTYTQSSFDLEKDPLFRAWLLHTSVDNHLLVINMHHIISDGWSVEVILRELSVLYTAMSTGQQHPLNTPKVQYKDFVAWQNQQLQSTLTSVSKLYWKSLYEGELPVLELSTDYKRPAFQSFNGDMVQFDYSNQQVAALRAIWQQNDATTFMGLLALVEVLLFRYSGQSDMIIGTPIAGRTHEDLEDQIGFYANTLALRIPFHADDDYLTLLQKVKQSTLGAYEHQNYPFDLLIEDLNLSWDSSRSPLFDVMVSLNGSLSPQNGNDDKDLSIELVDTATDSSKFDLDFVFSESEEGISGSITFNTDLFRRERIERMVDHFQNLLTAIVESPKQPVHSLTMVPAEALAREVSRSPVNRSFHYEATLHELFEAQVERTPEAIAVAFGEQQLTYASLDQKANQLAHFLIDRFAVKPNERIGLMMDKSEWLIVAMLGVLKSGGGYVPIDPKTPEERRNFILEDAAAKCLITDADVITACPRVAFNATSEIFTAYQDSPPSIETRCDDLAYIIYTSGSTGKPKGVMLEHYSVTNTVISKAEAFRITEDDHQLLMASIAFDASVYSIYATLFYGATLVVMENDLLIEPHEFRDFIKQHSVSIALFPPSFLSRLDPSVLTPLRCVMSGGEAVSMDLLGKFSEGRDVWNTYGPTECAITCAMYQYNSEDAEDENASLGYPVDHMSVFAIDRHGNALPRGIAGELCFAGPGVARGYVGREDLNKEKFISHTVVSGERVYKTGDLGQVNLDGRVSFYGRNDSQVKLRGYRIELDEVSSVFLSQEGVSICVTILETEHLKDPALVTYLQLEEGVALERITEGAKAKLPAYMIPAFILPLDHIPMTINGKIDRKKLPPVNVDNHVKKDHFTAQTSQEKLLVQLWEAVLDVAHVGLNDDFFALGGNSLNAISLVSEIYQKLQVEVSLRDIFNHSTVSDLAALLDGYQKDQQIVVKLNEESPQNKNAFLIPPIVGSPTIYKSMALRLKDRYNCYGFQFRGFEKGEEPYQSREELFNDFIKEISARTAHGAEVMIAGYSIGAVIAFELTKKLEALGYLVTLVLIDKEADKFPEGQDLSALLQNEMTQWKQQLSGLDFDSITNMATQMLGLFQDFAPEGQVREMIAFEAGDSPYPTSMSAWEKYVSTQFDLYYLEGDHYDMLQEANLQVIGKHLTVPDGQYSVSEKK